MPLFHWALPFCVEVVAFISSNVEVNDFDILVGKHRYAF